MTDEQLDRLGEYFVYHRVRERYGLTFEQFVEKYRRGTWEAWLAA
ncbi:hypothetical protein [Paenibacillus sp.]|nr:hypothetical protein [Paenibacillus sp.]HZG83867.1 hypothetical protein [Paenibacillus sp.]